MTEITLPVLTKCCSNPACIHAGDEQPVSNFYVRSGYKDNPMLPGHYNSECKDCLKARNGSVRNLPLEESRVASENLAIKHLKSFGIWAQTGKDSGAPDVDLTAWGVVWIEVKHARLEPHGGVEEFTFMTTPKQQKRGLLADIVMLICEWSPENYTYHLFRSTDPVFYIEGRVKTGFTFRPGRTHALKHGLNRVVMTTGMMDQAQNNWELIDAVRLEHAETLPDNPFPHRRWRDVE